MRFVKKTIKHLKRHYGTPAYLSINLSESVDPQTGLTSSTTQSCFIPKILSMPTKTAKANSQNNRILTKLMEGTGRLEEQSQTFIIDKDDLQFDLKVERTFIYSNGQRYRINALSFDYDDAVMLIGSANAGIAMTFNISVSQLLVLVDSYAQ